MVNYKRRVINANDEYNKIPQHICFRHVSSARQGRIVLFRFESMHQWKWIQAEQRKCFCFCF